LDVLKDGSRLNSFTPRLVVLECGGEHENTEDRVLGAFWSFLLLFPVGTFVIIRSAILWRQEKSDALLRSHSLTQPGPQPQLTGAGGAPLLFPRTHVGGPTRLYTRIGDEYRHWELRPSNRWPFSRTSWFGVLGGIIYLLFYIVTWVVLVQLGHRIPVGLRVHLLRPGVTAQRGPGIQPLLVHLVSAGPKARPSLYVDSEPVSWEKFAAILQMKLRNRPPDWPVYLQGEGPDLDVGPVVEAIDAIRGLHAEVVLLTRRPAPTRGQSKTTGDGARSSSPAARKTK
jgi:hypothetical protein